MSYPRGSAPPTSGVCSPSQRRVAEAFHGLALAPFPPSENNSGRGFMAKQIGYAVVGAGPFVEPALLPAFPRAGGETRLAAIVSDRTRAHALAREHPATGSPYDEFRPALQREDVQAVYLALSN